MQNEQPPAATAAHLARSDAMLVVFGSINLDFVFPVRNLPRAGETVFASRGRVEPGGKGANQAVAAARDGARVTFVGAVGRDAMADAALAGLDEARIRLAVARVAAPTGRAAINVDPQGYTTVAVDPGANLLARADQVEGSLLRRRTTLLLQLETEPEQAAALISRGRQAGCRIVLVLSPPKLIDLEALRAIDVLLGNKEEIAWLGERLGTASNPASVRAALGVTVVRMMGVQGAEVAADDGYLHMPAFPVHMRDTTGASDCFAGVLTAALAGGTALDGAVRRAAVAAALSTTRLGAQGSMPAKSEIDAALKHAPEPTRKQAEVQD